MPATTTASHTGDAYIDGVIYGTKWAVTSLKFSFPTAASQYGSPYGNAEPGSNFEAFNATQQAAVKAALAMYSSVANITFTQVTETSSTHADLRYAMSDVPGTAWAYMPTTLAEGGDAWFNNSSGWYDNPVKGNYAFASIVHETGHALGLKHPHEVSGSFAAMPADHDSLEYSVMSYRSYVGASTTTGYTNAADSYPQTLMMYDIAAIQSLYGANYNTNAGNTVYAWDPSSGQMTIDGVGQGATAGNKIFMTLWDGGGNDTYNFSAYTTGVVVDLQPGHWTTASATQLANLGNGHKAAGNIANALLYNGNTASLIENVIGGSGGDTIVGNAANNVVTGGAGSDSIDGLGGTNTAVYTGTHTQYLQIQNLDGTWTITDLRLLSANDGIDTLANIQYLKFSDGTFAIGGGAPANNHAPAATGETYATSNAVALVVAAGTGVLANDTDADGDALNAVLVSGPAHGVLLLGSNGGFTYTPEVGWTGNVTFSYEANDGYADSAPATVTINVTSPLPVNHTPVANTDSYSTAAGTPLVIAAGAGVLANDTDADGNPLTAQLVSGPAHGTLSLTSNGGFTFTPDAGWSGATSFVYRANDGTANSADTAVNLTVTAPTNTNVLPVAGNDEYSVVRNGKLTVSAANGLLANDSDANGDALTVKLVKGPPNGTLKLNADGSFTFTPKLLWNGVTSFTYQTNDGHGNSVVATATIDVLKSSTTAPPQIDNTVVVQNDSYTAKKSTALNVDATHGVLANDHDQQGDAITATLVSGPANGSLKFNADGSFIFTPKSGWTGTTSFTYKASDGSGYSTTATATIKVTATGAANGVAGNAAGLVGQDSIDLHGLFNHAPGSGNDTTLTQLLSELLHHGDHNPALEVDDMPAPACEMHGLPDLLHHFHSEFALG